MTDLRREDRRALEFAPLWILSALVGKQRQFDPLEQDALWRSVEDAKSRAMGLEYAVLSSVSLDPDRLLLEFEADGRPIASGLASVVSVLDKLQPSDAADFKEMLIRRVAAGVARARGPFGQRVNDDDAKVLALLEELLEWEPVA